MSYIYQVVPLSESGGLPVVPGAAFVSYQIARLYVAYGPAVNYRHTTLAILYKDDSGNYLVGAEPEVFDTLPDGQTLAEFSGDWNSYHFVYQNADSGKLRSNDFGDIPLGILIALSVGAPLPLALMPDKFQGAFDIIGMQRSTTHQMADFRPTEIESGSTWYGDTI